MTEEQTSPKMQNKDLWFHIVFGIAGILIAFCALLLFINTPIGEIPYISFITIFATVAYEAGVIARYIHGKLESKTTDVRWTLTILSWVVSVMAILLLLTAIF